MNDLRNVSVDELDALLSGGAQLLDVRGDDEWAAGRAADATHVVLASLPDHVDEIVRDRTVICVCRSGGRSARAARFLLEAGVDAVNLEGGMIAWVQHGRPLVGDGPEPVVI